MGNIRPHYVPAPYQDSAESGRLILRDGSTATIRLAGSEDREALQAFFERLSPESRWHRFFTQTVPAAQLLDTLCDASNPRRALSLVVVRQIAGEPSIIATASYIGINPQAAEVSFAVDDGFQGKGLGTLLLERLAVLAVKHGFDRFWALTQSDNRAMQEVFRESGFTVTEELDSGYLEVALSVVPNEKSVERSETRDRVATAASLRPFFRPHSVAVIGASRDVQSIGRRVLSSLRSNGFGGPIYPINPKAAEIEGLKAFPTIRDVPKPVDLAVIAVPRDAVLPVVDECASCGVRAVVVITAGFAEVGAEGRDLQQQLVEKVRGYGMRLVGPNCMGLLNADAAVRLNASFSPIFPDPGPVAMSSQSGALGLAILAAAKRFDLGLSTFVSVGNKADVSGNDLLQYWEEDDATRVILLYLESFGNPRRFARIARRVSRRKPIVAVKAGRGAAGKRAAGSHTAALAASDVAVDALFQQTGVIRAETLEEMFDLAATLGSQPLPTGRRVAIVTNAGGPAILCTDACEADGLQVPELSAGTKAKLKSFLPAAAGISNPVDMMASASPEHFRRTIETVLASGEVDALIVIYIPVGLAETAAVSAAIGAAVTAARAGAGKGKPVLACLMSEDGSRTQIPLENEKIPSYVFPESAAHVLSKAAVYANWRAKPQGMLLEFDEMDLPRAKEICQAAVRQRGAGWLTSEETRQVLTATCLPVAAGGVARTSEGAAELARQIGLPVAVKLASHSLVHKTEIGGIHLNVRDADGVRKAFDDIRARLARDNRLDAMEGVLIQPMLAGGVEVMVGMSDDAQFGPLLAFGLGGIHVEILADVCFRIAPLTDRDAHEMVRAIRGFRLLEGYRGHPAADVAALEDVLLRVSRLVEEVPEISELDMNPIFALPPGEGCRIVDARVRINSFF